MCQCGKYGQVFAAFAYTLVVTAIFFVGGCFGNVDVRIVLGIFLAFLNVVTACLFWMDKLCAVEDYYRTAEWVLFYLAFYGSPIGAIFGMYCCCCRHKTNKNEFIAIAVVLIIFNLAWVFVYLIVTAKTTLSYCYK